MTQTENLKLNLWAPSDAVNLGQMNDNFQKLDTAGNYVKLMEVRDTGGEAVQINLNFTGIPLRGYRYLELEGMLLAPSDTYYSLPIAFIRLNGVNTNVYYAVNMISSATACVTTPSSRLASLLCNNGAASTTDSSFRARLYWGKNAILCESASWGFAQASDKKIGLSVSSEFTALSSNVVTPDSLTQINIGQNMGYPFLPGTKVTVYGVR